MMRPYFEKMVPFGRKLKKKELKDQGLLSSICKLS